LHGDIGFVSPGDVFLCFSKSGESQELLELIPHIRKKGAFAIGIVSHPDSRLSKACELSVFLPIQRELCPFDLAPTTSAAAQLIFGDCLAIALMKAKNFSLADFAANHPSGFLGRKITLKVSDLMLKGKAIPICQPGDPLIQVLHELSSKCCGCLLVVDGEQHLQGIFTDGDLRRAIESKGPDALQMPLVSLMTRSPKMISADCLVMQAMQRMEEDPAHPVTVLPVVENHKVLGLLRMHDILQGL
jgi:arabinose-5-phosphate isomerase